MIGKVNRSTAGEYVSAEAARRKADCYDEEFADYDVIDDQVFGFNFSRHKSMSYSNTNSEKHHKIEIVFSERYVLSKVIIVVLTGTLTNRSSRYRFNELRHIRTASRDPPRPTTGRLVAEKTEKCQKPAQNH